MKLAFYVGSLALLFASCQKNLSEKDAALSITVASDALLPLPCHSTSFVTDYPVVAGAVPPFTFTKTLYSDTRVKTIYMVTRKNPIHQFFNRESIELSGQFSYGPNRAYLKGTKKIWSHYNYGNGVMKKLLETKNVNLKFYFTPEGICERVTDLNYNTTPAIEDAEYTAFYIGWENKKMVGFYVKPDPGDPFVTNFYYPIYDQYGNVLTYDIHPNSGVPNLTYTYDYTKPRGTKNYSYIPSQNWFSQEYSLLEVMQWLPQSNHQRKSVSVAFWLPNTTERVVQSQVYKNYQFDARGNQTSVTYGDNVPQKTTWYCK